MNLGFGVIVRNSEHEILSRLLKTVKGVDNIYITVCSPEQDDPCDEIKALAEEHKAQLSTFKWVNDFSAARNFNMSQCKDDWYVWGDSDDEIDGLEKAKGKLEKLNPTIRFVLCPYNYSFTPNGTVSTKHPKERFIRNDGMHKWKGRLHESCVSDIKTDGTEWDDIFWNHRTTEERSTESYLRNVQIIEDEIADQLKEGKVDPRTAFNLGQSYAGVAQRTGKNEDWERTAMAFVKYLQMKPEWDEQIYMAWKYLAICYMRLERNFEALDALFVCLRVKPQYSETYGLLGSIYEAMGDDDKAEAWHVLNLVSNEPNKYADDKVQRVMPSLYALASIASKRGKFKDAKDFMLFAHKLVGDKDEYVNGMLEEIGKIEKLTEESQAIVKELDKIEGKEERMKAWKALDQQHKSHPAIVNWRRVNLFKEKSSGKEISIFCGMSLETWTPESEKTGIGGSEEAVINLSKELVNLGWGVNVYGTHGPEAKEYDGVWYRPWWEWSPDEPTDIFISWRDPTIFDYRINAKKTYCWLHDVMDEKYFTAARLERIGKIMVLSKYHRDIFPNIPDDKFFLTGNGIKASHFDLELERKPHQILYTSAPDRGLECLLSLWPQIREKVPDAELYWAYGWKTYDNIHKNNPQMMAYKRKIVAMLRQDGVHELGRIGHEELAKLMQSSGVWAYPTEFTEIFCITAVKMQAAGCFPVCTTVAAIGEDQIVKFGKKLDVPDMYTNEAAQQEFISEVAKACDSTEDRSEMRKWAKETWDWSNTAKGWDSEFKV